MKQFNNGTIKTAFFGTHDFAATILQAMINDPQISVDLVITQPDKPTGRSRKLQPPPIKTIALQHNIKIAQPTDLKSYALNLMPYALGVTAQYGLIIPQTIFNAPKYGTLNVHASLLPKYRGASPIQSALMNGETETGVTIMKMDAGLDTGPIILQKTIAIDPDETYPELEKKLVKIGSAALLEAVPKYISGELPLTPQDNSQATVCKQLTREDGKVDWRKSAREIYNQYRGLTPWPGIWTIWNGKRLKLLAVKAQDFAPPQHTPPQHTPPQHTPDTPGKVSVENDKIYIGCGGSAIEVMDLQLEGKKTMNVKNFLNGFAKIKNAELQ
ncbi:MAG: methionyl-tRNA formyltransferase [Patescibacteria group bacterium]